MIMPFSKTNERHTEEYWNEFYETLKKIMTGLCYECERSDTGPYSLIKNIIHNLQKSDLTIAVLTDRNANVFYELGIRHSLRNGTIMIINESQKLPFDVSAYGIIVYSDDMNLESELKDKIAKYLSKISSDAIDNPVLDTFGFKLNDLRDENFSPLKFEWRVNDQEDGRRIWVRKSIYQWEESCPDSPSLPKKTFACLGESVLYNVKGFEVLSLFLSDNLGFRIFVPNKGEKDMRLFSAITNKQDWKPFSHGSILYF